jgi:hypothetical protein
MTIRWTGDLPRNIRNINPYIQGRLAAATHAFAPRAEAYLKSNAPWTDRTGAARGGLTARPEVSATEYRVILAHGVDYGIWLEIAHSGAYAVIIPSIPVLGAQYFRLAARMAFIDRTMRRI